MSSKGAVFERKCRDVLVDAGWFVVRVSDGADADLVAIRSEGGVCRTLLVECKSGKATAACGPAQWNRLFDLAERIDATPVLADKVQGKSAPRFWRLTDRKQAGRFGVKQPRVPFNIDAWEGDRWATSTKQCVC